MKIENTIENMANNEKTLNNPKISQNGRNKKQKMCKNFNPVGSHGSIVWPTVLASDGEELTHLMQTYYKSNKCY